MISVLSASAGSSELSVTAEWATLAAEQVAATHQAHGIPLLVISNYHGVKPSLVIRVHVPYRHNITALYLFTENCSAMTFAKVSLLSPLVSQYNKDCNSTLYFNHVEIAHICCNTLKCTFFHE